MHRLSLYQSMYILVGFRRTHVSPHTPNAWYQSIACYVSVCRGALEKVRLPEKGPMILRGFRYLPDLDRVAWNRSAINKVNLVTISAFRTHVRMAQIVNVCTTGIL
jgi:hypothetical protein